MSLDPALITTGYCWSSEREHHECAGQCPEPMRHTCDAPSPEDPIIRCIDIIGHDGQCYGVNGPFWETPEPYAGREQLKEGWWEGLKPWEITRPASEQTLEVFS